MLPSSLKNWRIFSLLKPEFIPHIRMVIVYGVLANEALIVTKEGLVYGLGINASGCLGSGEVDFLCPKEVKELCEMDIKTFAHGKGPRVLILTEQGKVCSWKDNGLFTWDEDYFVVDIACGSHHSLALTDEGEVYEWKENDADVSKSEIKSIKVNFKLLGKHIISISCGHSFSIAVTDSGEVYGWGENGVGELGIGNYFNQRNPRKAVIPTDVIIEKIVCGYAHTLAVCTKGILYVWGGNSYGQLGLGKEKMNACTPVKLEVQGTRRVLDIAASHYNHISVAMGEDNQIFIWGQCLGQSITYPICIPLASLHDVFACYASPSVMHQPLILHDEEDELGLIDCLKEAFDDPNTSDLIIQVGGKPIYVHKAILKIRCQYFRTMFQGCWSENNQSVIEHEQFSYDVYRAFLKYLYTNEIDLSLKDALEFFELANTYSESQLKKRCIQMVKKMVRIRNVAFLYGKAIVYNSKELEEYCFKYALNNMTAVVQSSGFAELDAHTVKSFIIKASRAGVFKK